MIIRVWFVSDLRNVEHHGWTSVKQFAWGRCGCRFVTRDMPVCYQGSYGPRRGLSCHLASGHRCSCTKVKLRPGCHSLMLPRIACQEHWGGSSVLVQSWLLVDTYPLERSRMLFSVLNSGLFNSSWLTDHRIKSLLALQMFNYNEWITGHAVRCSLCKGYIRQTVQAVRLTSSGSDGDKSSSSYDYCISHLLFISLPL